MRRAPLVLLLLVACAPRPQVLDLPPCRVVVLHDVVIGKPYEPVPALPQVACCPTGSILLYVVDGSGRPLTDASFLASGPFSQMIGETPLAPGVYLLQDVPAIDVVTIRFDYGWCADRTRPARFNVHVEKRRTTPILVVADLRAP